MKITSAFLAYCIPLQNLRIKVRLVFIHLGSKFPEHLELNIKRHLQVFPNIPVSIIHNYSEENERLNLDSLDIYMYRRSNAVFDILSSLNHDNRFRNNFWINTLERFYALEKFHAEKPNEKILHIESDVLLLPNFPWKSFNSLDEVWYNRYNSKKDVAALLFSPNLNKTNQMVKLISAALANDPNLTDMTALSTLSHSYHDQFKILPSSPKLKNSFLNNYNVCAIEEKMSISENFDLFGGIFDPAPFGMWLTGQDPRNHFGFTQVKSRNIIESGDSFLDPAKFSYKLNVSGELVVSIDKTRTDIWSLHVHSKNKELFGENWVIRLRKFVDQSQSSKQYSFFSLNILIELLIANKKQKTLIRFILNLPYLRKIKAFLKIFIKYRF